MLCYGRPSKLIRILNPLFWMRHWKRKRRRWLAQVVKWDCWDFSPPFPFHSSTWIARKKDLGGSGISLGFCLLLCPQHLHQCLACHKLIVVEWMNECSFYQLTQNLATSTSHWNKEFQSLVVIATTKHFILCVQIFFWQSDTNMNKFSIKFLGSLAL